MQVFAEACMHPGCMSVGEAYTHTPQGASRDCGCGALLLPRLPAGRCAAGGDALFTVQGDWCGQRLTIVHGPAFSTGACLC